MDRKEYCSVWMAMFFLGLCSPLHAGFGDVLGNIISLTGHKAPSNFRNVESSSVIQKSSEKEELFSEGHKKTKKERLKNYLAYFHQRLKLKHFDEKERSLLIKNLNADLNKRFGFNIQEIRSDCYSAGRCYFILGHAHVDQLIYIPVFEYDFASEFLSNYTKKLGRLEKQLGEAQELLEFNAWSSTEEISKTRIQRNSIARELASLTQ